MRVAVDVSAVPRRPAGAGVYVTEVVRALGALLGEGAGGGTAHPALALVAVRGDAARWRAVAPAAEVADAVPRPRPLRLGWEQVGGPVLARRLGVDVWHGPHYTMPARPGRPAVVTVHDLTFFDHPEWHERAKVLFFRRMVRLAVRRAHVLVCVSGHTADRLQALLDPRQPVLVVPHGVDHGRFRPDGAPGLVAADLAALGRLGVHRPYVAFAGTLEPRKDVPSLVAAFAAVAGAHPDVDLVLAGQPGWGAAAVDQAVRAARLGPRVHRLGYVDDAVLPALYRRAEVVAYPSLVEGFGLPALEAMACGAPVLTTSGSAMQEVTGGAARLVPPGDRAALAQALDELLADGAARQRLREAGPAVAAPFTWRRCAEQHVAAYRLAAGRPLG